VSWHRNPFDGGHPLPRETTGPLEQRHKARLVLASLVSRNGGGPDELRMMLSALRLWPQQDTAPGEITPL